MNIASDLNAGSDVDITLTVEGGDNISQSNEIEADSNIIVVSAGSDQLSAAFDVGLFKTVTECYRKYNH